MTTELYILLKVKGEYNQSRKDAWIYKRLKEPDIEAYKRMLHDCRNRNLIEVRGKRNLDCSLYYRDLFLTPYGEQRLNQLEAEYIADWCKNACKVLFAVVGFLAALLTIWKETTN